MPLRRLKHLLVHGTLGVPALAVAQVVAPAAEQPSPPVAAPTPASTTPRASETSAGGQRLLPLEVTINGMAVGNWVLLDLGGKLYAGTEAFEEWRLNRTTGEPVNYRGQLWFPLASVPGYEARFDPAAQSVKLTFLPQAFVATRLTQSLEARPPVSRAMNAGFLNYDLNFTHTTARGADAQRDVGALMEFGWTSPLGVLSATALARGLSSGTGGTTATVRRLETNFVRDFPDSKLTLVVGDTTTRAGLWGRGVYFGGIKFGRNFSLAPGFVTQPLPVLTGVSSAPSTVELYINDALRQTSQVPSGPFVVDSFPTVSAGGQARVVVRDLLGRETVLVQSFFTSTELLEQGLSDWSVEAGAERVGLGLKSADYGERFASGLWRYGLTKRVTLEAHGEFGQKTRSLGVGASAELPFAMLGQFAVAGSQSRGAGAGWLWLAGVERDGPVHGFSLRAEGTGRGWRQLGQDASLLYRLQLSASYNFRTERFGSFGFGFARIDSYDRGPITTASLNYTVRVGEHSSLTFSAVRARGSGTGAAGGSSLGVNLLVPLEDHVTVTANATHRGNLNDGYVAAARNLSDSTGFGWRTLAGRRQNDAYAEGGIYYQGARGLYTADASASPSQQSVRFGAQGALVVADGQAFASRRLDDSFALVGVPGYAGIGVGFQGSVLTRTDAQGKALVPRLLAYQANSIRLNANELPISAEIDSIEQVVVPPARSGVKVTFPVRSGRGALLRIVLEDGEAAPAGAELELRGDTKEFFVARRGEAFVTGLQATNTLVLKHKGQSCSMAVELPPGNADDIARVGPIVCKGVRR